MIKSQALFFFYHSDTKEIRFRNVAVFYQSRAGSAGVVYICLGSRGCLLWEAVFSYRFFLNLILRNLRCVAILRLYRMIDGVPSV